VLPEKKETSIRLLKVLVDMNKVDVGLLRGH
jgi:hypothetical protein